MEVLLVEDDDAIAAPLAAGLTREGFAVRRVATGGAALDAQAAERADVVLLDLGLPDIDGFEVCRRIRAASTVPIIVISARGEEVDRVVGLELGADDYMVKPFGFRELLARIRAVTRRLSTVPDGDRPQRIGALEIDRRTHRVRVDGTEVALTPKEFDLLACLAEEPGTVVTRQRLLDEVWDPHWYGPTRTLDVHVASVRKKLGEPRWIETVRGVGFRMGAPEPRVPDADQGAPDPDRRAPDQGAAPDADRRAPDPTA
jgi:DNA-binding response OmpR family regulator